MNELISENAKKRRLKVLIYGEDKTGKTTAALNFPAPFLIDAEEGAIHAQYLKKLEEQNGTACYVRTFADVKEKIKMLGIERHPYKTLIIDSITKVFYETIDDIKEATEKEHYMKDRAAANRRGRELYGWIEKLDMNIVFIAHEKDLYKNDKVIGVTYDGFSKLDYEANIVLRFTKDKNNKRVATVDGTKIETFKDGETFEFTEKALRSRYDSDLLDREAVPYEMATKEQVREISSLIRSEEELYKIFNSEKIDTLEDTKEDRALKIIKRLEEIRKKEEEKIEEVKNVAN